VDEQTVRIISGVLAALCFALLLRRRARRKSRQDREP
jgi:hypothetical protein